MKEDGESNRVEVESEFLGILIERGGLRVNGVSDRYDWR